MKDVTLVFEVMVVIGDMPVINYVEGNKIIRQQNLLILVLVVIAMSHLKIVLIIDSNVNH